jgi:hypothetical protein
MALGCIADYHSADHWTTAQIWGGKVHALIVCEPTTPGCTRRTVVIAADGLPGSKALHRMIAKRFQSC